MAKPKIIIVDKNDNQIGSKDRSEISYADIYRVSALFLTNSNGDVLLAQRKFTKKNNPGMWGPAVAGTVEDGESYIRNIVKETEEEIGLRDLTIAEGPKFFMDDGEHKYFCQWYTALTDKKESEFSIQEEEVEGVKWVSSMELQRLIHDHPDQYVGSLIPVLKYLEKR